MTLGFCRDCIHIDESFSAFSLFGTCYSSRNPHAKSYPNLLWKNIYNALNLYMKVITSTLQVHEAHLKILWAPHDIELVCESRKLFLINTNIFDLHVTHIIRERYHIVVTFAGYVLYWRAATSGLYPHLLTYLYYSQCIRGALHSA